MSEQSQLGPSDDGTVMLDIGGDIGALIILTEASMQGAEIEISPLSTGAFDVFQAAHPHDHGDGHTHEHDDGVVHAHDEGTPPRTHVAVRERRGAGGTRYAAIYPGLREGEYTVWGLDGHEDEVVRIDGGQVAELDWR